VLTSAAIDALLAAGPIFSISKLIGHRRTQLLEKWLLMRFRGIVLLFRSIPLLFISLIPVYFVLNIFGGLSSLSRSSSSGYGSSDLGWSELILSVLGFVVVTAFFGIISMDWAPRFVHRRIQALCLAWRYKLGSEAPWPFSMLRGPYLLHVAYPFMVAFPVVTFSYLVLWPLLLTAAFVFLTPFAMAEVVRSKLNPESEHYLDILAYLVSVGAMLHKLV
jgi:hypothetical protein